MASLKLRLRVQRKADLLSYYPRHFLPPPAIHQFIDQCFIELEYGDGGTLIDVITPLSSSFNSSEHEYLVAHIAYQVSTQLVA